MSHIKDKVVLITGASSGIGEATARVLSRKGAAVVLGARRTGRLKPQKRSEMMAEELNTGLWMSQRLRMSRRLLSSVWKLMAEST